MKIRFLFIAFIGLIVVACGEGSAVDAPFHNNIDSSAIEVATKYDLGTCSAQNEGRSVWVKSESQRYNCKFSKWIVAVDTTIAKDSIIYADSSNLYADSSNFVVESPDTAEIFDLPKIVYGTLKDSRDNHTYKTVKIGEQVWMAENLNYKNDSIFSACTPEEFGGCEKYGRAYIWHSAMELVSVSESQQTTPSELEEYILSPHRGVCPEGWHIPNDAEWDTLMVYVEARNGKEFAGTSLKSTDWDEMKGLPQGTNRFGFSAIQAPDGWLSKTPINFKQISNRAAAETNPEKIKPAFSISIPQIINDAGEIERHIGMQASFCSALGKIWQLSTDEFWNNTDRSYQYNTCYVRCIKD